MPARHAYLILAHKNFRQLQKLIELLDHPLNDIYVHVDAKAGNLNETEWKWLCGSSNLTFISDRQRVNWGGVSIMRAELALLKEATSHHTYAYYHLLSGMDLPIKSQDLIHKFFEQNSGKEFINLWQLRKSNLSRFRYFTVFPEGEGRFPTRIVNHVVKGLQMAVGHRINRNVDFHMGSQWFSITDELARYVIAHEDWLEHVFRHTSTCDEIFLPTLVYNSPFRNRLFLPETVKSQKEVNLSNMRFIDWSRGESVRHPWTFRADDFDLLKSVDHLWARKFDETVDSEIIDRIYKMLKTKRDT